MTFRVQSQPPSNDRQRSLVLRTETRAIVFSILNSSGQTLDRPDRSLELR